MSLSHQYYCCFFLQIFQTVFIIFLTKVQAKSTKQSLKYFLEPINSNNSKVLAEGPHFRMSNIQIFGKVCTVWWQNLLESTDVDISVFLIVRGGKFCCRTCLVSRHSDVWLSQGPVKVTALRNDLPLCHAMTMTPSGHFPPFGTVLMALVVAIIIITTTTY